MAPVGHLLRDQQGVGHKNSGPGKGLNHSVADGDFPDIPRGIFDFHQVAGLDASSEQENQTPDEIIDNGD